MSSFEDSAKRVWGARVFKTALSTLSRLSCSNSPPNIQRSTESFMSSKQLPAIELGDNSCHRVAQTSREDPTSPEQIPASAPAFIHCKDLQPRLSRATSSELDGRTVEGSSVWDDVAVTSDHLTLSDAPETLTVDLPPAPDVVRRRPTSGAGGSDASNSTVPASAARSATRTSLKDLAPFSKKDARFTRVASSPTSSIACRVPLAAPDGPSSMLLAFESVEDWGRCTPYASSLKCERYGAGFKNTAL
ncbi:hypothetical protein T484DRAFT_1929042 [Baffinella frigidus]|nr:hypothetical protein T484DRAFT_1929042 [Cryptophyta sp. CCMP2293]